MPKDVLTFHGNFCTRAGLLAVVHKSDLGKVTSRIKFGFN